MSIANFADRLNEAVAGKNSRLVVGIDPNPELLPPAAEGKSIHERVDYFGRRIIEAVCEEAAAVKFQSAFYELLGSSGVTTLEKHLAYAGDIGLLTILDAKRGDIGHTAGAYAAAYLGPDAPFAADALTVSPYLGKDSIGPFVETAKEAGRGLFVLVKTSNPGSKDFQDLITTDGKTLYLKVAEVVAELGKADLGDCGYSSVGAVCGATYPELLAELRDAMPAQIFLIPGVGAQGGSVESLGPAFDDQGFGALVVAARSIIYAYRERAGDYADAARGAAAALREEINRTAVAGR